MNLNFKQSQFELFPDPNNPSSEVGKPRFFSANLTLTFENLVIVGIVALILAVVSYSVGVEKGKKYALREVREMVHEQTMAKVATVKEAQELLVEASARKSALPQIVPTSKGASLPSVESGAVESAPKIAVKRPNTLAAQVSAPESTVAATPKVVPQTQTVVAQQKTLQDQQNSVYSTNSKFGKPFTVQIASYKTESFAQRVADLMKQKGYETQVLSKGSHAIVCVGNFAEQKQAQVFSEQFRKKYKEYKDCLVRRL